MHKMKWNCLVMIIVLLTVTFVSAQNKQQDDSGSYLNKRWGEVATRMPSQWYGSEEAKLVAENLLVSQKEIGGWAKNEPYHLPYSDSLKTVYLRTKTEKGGTFDNGSTITELRFLAKVYAHFNDSRYKQAFEKGVNYILSAQYENGGWPQYYPVKDSQDEILLDKTVPYSMHITFNDDAMVNVMVLLREIYSGDMEFAPLKTDEVTKEKAKKAFDKGVDCILKAQIRVDNKPTVWCAQHHEITLAPANARAYELASFSGSESIGVIGLLMDIDHPSKDMIAAVNGAVKWLDDHKIEGIKIGSETDQQGNRNRIVVSDKNAAPLWARFYDLETGKPFFCSRDGIKRNSMAEISYERRNGYSWYTNAPAKVMKQYPEWQKKWSPDSNALNQ
ncbi:MAG: pectate lyase [Prolixibacteraceae bacterium]